MKNEGCMSLKAMHTDTSQGSNCLSFSCRLFLLCILFNQSYFNCISILQRQYLLDLPSDYNTIHIQADPNGYSFYMQSISETAFNSKLYINSSRLHILQIFNLHMPAFTQVRSIFNINTLCWLLIIYHIKIDQKGNHSLCSLLTHNKSTKIKEKWPNQQKSEQVIKTEQTKHVWNAKIL